MLSHLTRVLKQKRTLYLLVVFTLLSQVLRLRSLLIETSSGGDQTPKYFTWESPSFAYFNNQFILHLASAVHNPLPNRKLLSPGITFSAVRGVQAKKHIPVTDVFSETGLGSLGYETSLDQWTKVANETSPLRVDYYSDLADVPERPVIQATARTESYWKWNAIRFTAEAFILPFTSRRWRLAARQFQLAAPLQQCVDSVLPDVIPSAIAMHLRMWPSDLSFGQRDPCHRNEVPVLKHFFSKCEWTGEYLYNKVQRVQNSETQPVVIATDNRDHPAVQGLVEHLGPRAHFMEQTEACSAALRNAYPEAELDWRSAAYWPIVEAAALVQADSFVGSFWSTFSQLIAVRRLGTDHTFFVQNRGQAFVWRAKWMFIGMLVGVPAVVGIVCWRRYSRKPRVSLKSEV